MTTLALQARVFAFQRISGLVVVEALLWRIPVHERKVSAIVFGMAARAFLAGAVFGDQGCVQPALLVQAPSNLRMAIQTFECRCSFAQPVTRGTLRRAADGFVRSRKRPGRNLRPSRAGRGEQHRDRQHECAMERASCRTLADRSRLRPADRFV